MIVGSQDESCYHLTPSRVAPPTVAGSGALTLILLHRISEALEFRARLLERVQGEPVE